ncbi:hypothetical protein N7474_002321 [Penicillium riverlandense]|uniref:uncharacterized protein n=1 Tax=Penicillium riverlandense TaxID=1903569 RepID=UPI0025482A61|nr:uncharacterized protein N7474_002321 [Penicillium riverlandense]KAJ5825183.1 hypothetical protein N7474_002321 [Penicillium riverlandense]
MRGRWREASRRSHEHNRSTENELLSRVSRIEHQLSLILRPEAHTQNHLGDTLTTPTRPRGRQPLDDNTAANSLTRSQGSSFSPRVPTFSGETSLTHNITMIEGRLEQMGVIYERLRSTSPGHSFGSHLTPSPEALPDNTLEWGQTSYIRKVLDSHRVVPNEELWRGFMRTFCEEVHILVPFLHIPTLWTLYEETWEKFFNFSRHDHLNSENRIQVAHILLCLANGKCVGSSRLHSGEEQYSAGWSLYNAGKDIFGDLLDSFHDGDNQIIVLQTITLMVVYLFRLDAHGPAEKVLALTISHAHHIGLHRRKVVDGMGTFTSEMCRRLWWCVYLLDRRLALETGRPFLIQDVNVDVGLPQDVSDEWLRTCHDLQFPVSNAASCENICSPVAYLIAMTAYSKVIGKIWEALYGAPTNESTPSYFLNEYLMHLITQSQREI